MMKYNFIVYFSLLAVFHLGSCKRFCETLGSQNLGNKLTLLDGDRVEDRLIVYCTGTSGGCCFAGIPVVPSNNRRFDSKGRYAEYVTVAASNKNWVLAKTIQVKGKHENYWIISKDFDIKNLDCDKINCDSILQNRVFGPLDSTEFNSKRKTLSIDLNFN